MRQVEFGDLILRWVASDLWTVYEDFAVFIDGNPIYVPKGFSTDLASIPKFLWPILSPMGPYTPAAVLHDYLYATQPCPKEKADEMFRDAMLCLNVDTAIAEKIYKAVKDYGHSAWGGHSARLSTGVVTPKEIA